MSSDPFPPVPNYGPITTVFTPASSCTRVAFQSNVPFVVTIVAGGHSDCYPGSRLYQLHYGYLSGRLQNPYYSPALFCPQGHTTAATWAAAIGGIGDSPKPDSSEEAYYCCPSYVSYYLGDYGNCYSTLTHGHVVTNERLDNSSWYEGPTTTVNEPTTLTAVAWSIQIRYHSSDLARLSNSATSTTSSGAASSSASATQTSAPTVVVAPPTPISHGLSTGAKAAIGVTIPVAFIVLLLAAFFFIFSSRRSRKRKVPAPSSDSALNANIAPSSSEGPGKSCRAEMIASTAQPQELSARIPRPLAVPVVPKELDSKPIG
ncbi:MAG: hypothetical protein M1830_008328 [Pleopsidium flavum]|nr:MAG: hypothetical protein M1830_008328 [Pleopsidium flavum]